jgi:hypothetical protein
MPFRVLLTFMENRGANISLCSRWLDITVVKSSFSRWCRGWVVSTSHTYHGGPGVDSQLGGRYCHWRFLWFSSVSPGNCRNCTLTLASITSTSSYYVLHEGVSKSFRTGRLQRELQMVQLSATRCSCISILWVSLVSFAAISLCVASQRVFIIVVVYFVMTQSGNFWIHPVKPK